MARGDEGGYRAAARRVVEDTAEATAASSNEENLRHVIEMSLERECRALGTPWTPYQLDRTLRDTGGADAPRFADVVHGALIIEYEPPRCFAAGRSAARVRHAQDQAIDYAGRMSREEGRPISEYILIVWDGAHIIFGDIAEQGQRWERIQSFDQAAAERLLHLLRDQGRPLVHPAILRQLIGPDSGVGAELIPELYRAIRTADRARGAARQTKTTLLFKEWQRLFGQWSHLPPPYAEFIKPICLEMNVFSEDRYVGGIESDISTVITFQAAMKWLAPGGRLAFFITATVFANESSQGFRRFARNDGSPIAHILAVEDFKAIAPFEGVTNHPALLLIEQGAATTYPVPYRIWTPPTAKAPLDRSFADGAAFRAAAQRRDLLAEPVPGSDAGPWLKGTETEHKIWAGLFDASHEAHYRARKGITTDLNGAYFVRTERATAGNIWVTNDPGAGRKDDLPQLRRQIETEHVFPLMRGRGLSAFCAVPDPNYKVIVPQRGMHGDPNLPTKAPRTHRFFEPFETWLRQRGSYRRYQAKQPFWSTWSTGPYTFSKYKVLWKEMSGARFCAAYIGPVNDPVLGKKIVVPDHKLYFVPVATLPEARYLTGILNAPAITAAIAGYAAQLSLGTSVIENLTIPEFDPKDARHIELARLAGEITDRGGWPTVQELKQLNDLAGKIVREHTGG